MLNTITSIFNTLWQSIISFLPGSPFRGFVNLVTSVPYLPELNWFVPVSEMIGVLEIWLSAVALYYVYSAIMRFIRLL